MGSSDVTTAEMARLHVERDGTCFHCKGEWPCHAVVLIDRLDAAFEVILRQQDIAEPYIRVAAEMAIAFKAMIDSGGADTFTPEADEAWRKCVEALAAHEESRHG